MDDRPYPQGLDWAWLASDRVGHLGVFVTAARGPIPVQALYSDYPEDIEDQILTLPKASDADLLVRLPLPDDFIALAERGFFAYDWSDGALPEEYELTARPYRPLTLDLLPDNLLEAAKSVRFTKVDFANAWRLNVRAHMLCHEMPL